MWFRVWERGGGKRAEEGGRGGTLNDGISPLMILQNMQAAILRTAGCFAWLVCDVLLLPCSISVYRTRGYATRLNQTM